MMTNLSDTRKRLTEINNSLSSINQDFARIDAADNGTMTAKQRTAMHVKLAQAEALIDEVRRQLFDAQK